MKVIDLMERSEANARDQIKDEFDKRYETLSNVAQLGDIHHIVKAADREFKGVANSLQDALKKSLAMEKQGDDLYIRKDDGKIKELEKVFSALDDWHMRVESGEQFVSLVNQYVNGIASLASTFDKWQSSKEGQAIIGEIEAENR